MLLHKSHICIYMYMYMYIYICTDIYIYHMYIYVHVHVYIHICIYMYMYMYIYICTDIYIYLHIHIYIYKRVFLSCVPCSYMPFLDIRSALSDAHIGPLQKGVSKRALFIFCALVTYAFFWYMQLSQPTRGALICPIPDILCDFVI